MAKPKVRLHKGLSSELRRFLRTTYGMKLDEESAQLVLNGFPITFDPVVNQRLASIRDTVQERERVLFLMQEWEQQYPGRNPYPPIFAERVRDKVREAQAMVLGGMEPDLVEMKLSEVLAMCNEEMRDDEDR